jgi:integrase
MKLRKRIRKDRPESWEVDLGIVHGKRVQRFFKNKAEAERFFSQVKEARRRDGDRALLEAWQITEYRAAKAACKEMGIQLSEAMEVCRKYYLPPVAAPALPELLGLFLDSKTATGRRANYVTALKNSIGAFIGAHKGVELAALSRDVVAKYIYSMGVGPKSQLNTRGDIRSFFEWARKAKFLAKNPLAGDDGHIEIDEPERDKEITAFGVEEVRALLTACLRPEFRNLMGYVTAAVFLGVRPEEIKRSPLSSLHLRERTFVVLGLHSKTRSRRTIGMPRVAAVWFRLWRWYCPDMPAFTFPNLRKRFDALRKAAGITVWPHDVLRHTFGSMHLAAFEDEALTQKMMGHRPGEDTFVQHYRATYTVSGALLTKRIATDFWALTPKRAR